MTLLGCWPSWSHLGRNNGTSPGLTVLLLQLTGSQKPVTLAQVLAPGKEVSTGSLEASGECILNRSSIREEPLPSTGSTVSQVSVSTCGDLDELSETRLLGEEQ